MCQLDASEGRLLLRLHLSEKLRNLIMNCELLEELSLVLRSIVQKFMCRAKYFLMFCNWGFASQLPNKVSCNVTETDHEDGLPDT